VNGPLVLKLGGELLETPESRARIAALVAALASERPVAIVHGGGRAIDAELARRGIAPKKVDGLRITDGPTLEAVVSVLAGLANTELVAALVQAGVPAVGLTGVDAGFGHAVRAAAYRSTAGPVIDLGLVGDPAEMDASLVELLLVHGYVPVVASLGVDAGQVLNVNADVMACRLSAALAHADLVLSGATAGVLDEAGETIPILDSDAIDAMVAAGTATAGMIAKLSAATTALLEGVSSVRIIDGRELGSAYGLHEAPGTTVALGHAHVPR